jgi:26S proteasome regulatory subunit N13
VSQFSSALESGQLGPVVSQLSVNSDAVAAATQGNMQEFMKALEKDESSSSKDESSSSKDEPEKDKKEEKKDDKDDDHNMQLD